MDQPMVNEVPIEIVTELANPSYGGVVLVTFPFNAVRPPQALEDFVIAALDLDKGLEKESGVLNCSRVSRNRLIVSPTGPITPYDDVRSIKEAAKKGIVRAIKAGCRRPILVVQEHPDFTESSLVLILGALEALYVPIQIRELFPEKKSKILRLGIYGEGLKRPLNLLVKNALALEISRGVARDIGGGDPERMSAQGVAEYVKGAFKSTRVTVRVIDDIATIEAEYPLFAAVNRAANSVPRHRGRIVFLEYNPEMGHEQTVILVGKGVTYDTGGADIKFGGVMAGMSRDKCGAAAVAGFIKACELLNAPIRAVGVLCLARNSVGEECYVADELIVSRSGRTVRVGNTDAEGRMVMADLLYEMKEQAMKEKNPHIYTIATLTGHAVRAVGSGYTIVMDNHVARSSNHAEKLRGSGDSVADMMEVSTIRREDILVHKGQCEGDDIHQALNQPSTGVPRGHQGPAGFLLLASGLHESNLKYSHLDIAASGGSLPDEPTGAPILALAQHYKLIKY